MHKTDETSSFRPHALKRLNSWHLASFTKLHIQGSTKLSWQKSLMLIFFFAFNCMANFVQSIFKVLCSNNFLFWNCCFFLTKRQDFRTRILVEEFHSICCFPGGRNSSNSVLFASHTLPFSHLFWTFVTAAAWCIQRAWTLGISITQLSKQLRY